MKQSFFDSGKGPFVVERPRIWANVPGHFGLFQVWFTEKNSELDVWVCIRWHPFGKWQLWAKRLIDGRQRVVQRAEFGSEQEAKDFAITYAEISQ